MSTKLELDFPMLKTLQRKLEEVDGALDSAVTTALEDSNALIAQQLEAAMSKHRRTGKTQSTILKNTDVLKANTDFPDVWYYRTRAAAHTTRHRTV